jgi:hypothetical protein
MTEAIVKVSGGVFRRKCDAIALGEVFYILVVEGAGTCRRARI